MLGKKRKFKKISKAEPSFLVKLYKILNENESIPYIHWSEDGKSVIISDSSGLTKKVLPKYYNHHNFASFVRQLNMYNFHKVRTDQKNGEQKYIHNEFVKWKTIKEIQLIRRKIKTEEEKLLSGKIRNVLDKKIGTTPLNNNNLLDDKIYLDQIDKMDEPTKISKYENILKNGELSNLSNEKILGFLFEKLKESINNQKYVENEISNLIKQNNNLLQQLQICNNKLISQNDFCKKMKGLVIFLVTLVMRKKQNYKICRVDMNGGKGDNNNNKKSLVDFVFRYLDYHKNKNQNNNNNEKEIRHNENNKNKNINPIIQKNINPIIQKGENFTIMQNNLFQNLKNNNFDEYYKENDLSMGSFNKNICLDLDLKNAKSASSLNCCLNNSLFNQNIKK